MRSSVMHRTTSDGGASSSSAESHRWPRFFISRTWGHNQPRPHHRPPTGQPDPRDPSDRVRHPDADSLYEAHESTCRKLQALVNRMRSAPAGPSHVDAAYREFEKSQDTFSALCHALLQDDVWSTRADLCLAAIRDWNACLETLADAFRASLADTYRSYERNATPDMVDQLFNSRPFRKKAIQRMRNASLTRVISADPHSPSTRSASETTKRSRKP
ncbi:hypothetical protein CDD83_4945 [Cordyceps sp. RAO-2017]|nr:hypothetical protein CDD83_4945 [Cordyceps sp. RAO-2017]